VEKKTWAKHAVWWAKMCPRNEVEKPLKALERKETDGFH